MAGVVSGYPFDTLRIRIQQPAAGELTSRRTSAASLFRSILRSEGPAGFYRGMSASLFGKTRKLPVKVLEEELTASERPEGGMADGIFGRSSWREAGERSSSQEESGAWLVSSPTTHLTPFGSAYSSPPQGNSPAAAPPPPHYSDPFSGRKAPPDSIAACLRRWPRSPSRGWGGKIGQQKIKKRNRSRKGWGWSREEKKNRKKKWKREGGGGTGEPEKEEGERKARPSPAPLLLSRRRLKRAAGAPLHAPLKARPEPLPYFPVAAARGKIDRDLFSRHRLQLDRPGASLPAPPPATTDSVGPWPKGLLVELNGLGIDLEVRGAG
ncbi:Mitochondrial arginine transporter BAC2 [Platanthera guangdongensis]|uniref:Mitochondrial arginine transporter BAC2 n=1 Tax=Platanthera guangdongensis TaxID=2320717 RepID=A0ABR2MZM8_9ASPA